LCHWDIYAYFDRENPPLRNLWMHRRLIESIERSSDRDSGGSCSWWWYIWWCWSLSIALERGRHSFRHKLTRLQAHTNFGSILSFCLRTFSGVKESPFPKSQKKAKKDSACGQCLSKLKQASQRHCGRQTDECHVAHLIATKVANSSRHRQHKKGAKCPPHHS